MSELIERLRSPMVMSMFLNKSDLYAESMKQRSEAAEELEAKDQIIAELVEALQGCADYFDNKADSYYDEERHVGNLELRLYYAADAALSKANATGVRE